MAKLTTSSHLAAKERHAQASCCSTTLFNTLIFIFLTISTLPAWAEEAIRLGVIAFRPKAQAIAQWQPLAAYLETKLGRRVKLTIYDHPELAAAMSQNAVDVILTNPGHYILLKHRNKPSAPLVTLINLEAGHELTAFGGMIFARADASNINTLADLAGKRIAAVNASSLGGYQMQAFEMLEAGVALPEKEKLVITGMPHDRAVEAVLSGKADAGFVRSGVLKAMADEGKLDPARIKIINQQNLSEFPFRSSTRLYPEWPVAVMPQVDAKLARRLTVALLSLPSDSVAARAAGIGGFTIPADYSGVEDVLRKLRVAPFDTAPEFTLSDLWQKYAGWITALLGGLVLVFAAMGAALLMQNRRVKQSQQRFITLFEFSPEPMWIIADGLIIDCNMAAVAIFGYIDKATVLKRSPGDFSPELQPDGKNSRLKAEQLMDAAASGKPQRCEWVHIKADGSSLNTVISLSHITLNGLSVVLITAHDITERKQAEARLQLAASVFNHAREGIVITDASGTIIEINDTFTHITGYSREEALGQNPRILQSGQHGPDYYAAMWQAITQHGHWTGEMWNRRKNGEVYAAMETISAVRDANGKTQNYVSLFTDITPMKEQQQQLEHIAHYDALTGLPNRVLLADRLQHAMLQTQRRGLSLAVVYLDLDGFKSVNDQYGHEIGDKLLIALALRMKTALRDGDTLARIGGDEFVAVLVDLEHHQDCEPVLSRLLEAAAEPVKVGDAIQQVSASIGVTIYPRDGADADQLMRHADQAMYVAKQSGKNRYHLFDVDHDIAVQIQRESLEHIRLALDRREFVLHYQPKVNMKTGAVIGAEALIRWQHAERGLLMPIDFLPSIENFPISVELGEWVISTALIQLSEWQAAGLNISVSVNITAHQLQQDDFLSRLSLLLDAHPDVKPGNLELEILETSALEDITQVSRVMHACRELGVRFALDDFGTGYSSLTYLKRLPADVLKIDQSFVSDMFDNPNDLAIVEGVVGLAAAFRREVIAEGVETIIHGQLLLSLGCEMAQGYGIARPMPGSELPTWAASWRPDDSWAAWQDHQVSREAILLVKAEVEHRDWIQNIEARIAGKLDVSPLMNTHECHFNIWLETEGRMHFRDHPYFPLVIALHERVHAKGHELLELYAREGQAKAQTQLNELYTLRDELIVRLGVVAWRPK